MTKREQLCLTRSIAFKGSGKICQLHIISDNNLSTVTSCYNVLLVDLIFDLFLLLGLNSKHHRCGYIALRNADFIV